ncbi:hypothetical protein BG000_001496 [Podila horticola]|nr:hypothetical protein BG000_001496 [Podila horticola]
MLGHHIIDDLFQLSLKAFEAVQQWVHPGGEAESYDRFDFTSQVPAYQIWFPQLHVAIPGDCYSCGRCNSLECVCWNLTEVYERTDYEAEGVALFGMYKREIKQSRTNCRPSEIMRWMCPMSTKLAHTTSTGVGVDQKGGRRPRIPEY